jgi:predicted O-linked N-acetylglucosamine transferase (SPINDLY family)
MKLKLYELANKDFDHAIKLNPLLAQAYANRGSLAQLTDRYQIATSDFEKSLSIDPSMKKLIGSLLHSKMHRCDWNEFEKLRQVFLGFIEREECLTNPFVLLSVIDSLSLQKKSAEHEVRTVIPLRNTLGPISPYKNHQKIRLGFFSADLREHAVAYLTAELFEKINKNTFEIIVFSVAMPSQDSMTQRISSACDHFIEIGQSTDEAAAAIARKMEIDIAIDLGGFTKDNRLGIFSYRAAPIQISYIGYLGTTGAPYVDYILADKTLIPEQYRDFYSEKIAYLPSYQVNDSKRVISDRVFSRKEFGLPETGFIFCCFNNNYKLTPSTFDCWMRILKSTEGSSLLLHSSHIEIEKNLKNEATKRGVDPSRIFFCAQLPRAEYLARFRIADLFLDTLPYNAGTIASDALWAGLPVLTLMGQSFVSRMCASVLTSIDLPELITNTSDEFVNCAIELAHDKEKLQLIKNKIARNRHTTQLFDSELFCKNFEIILNEMHRRSLAGLSPDHILQ